MLNGASLQFKVEGAPAFEVPLPDVMQVGVLKGVSGVGGGGGVQAMGAACSCFRAHDEVMS